MITMTEFIEKVDAIMGQQMDDTKANQLCRLYALSGEWHDMINTGEKENIIDCCYEMILKLHEQKLL